MGKSFKPLIDSAINKLREEFESALGKGKTYTERDFEMFKLGRITLVVKFPPELGLDLDGDTLMTTHEIYDRLLSGELKMPGGGGAMIKLPVHGATELDNEDDFVYTGEIYDDDGNSICIAELDLVDEIVKRINLHSCLVEALKYSVDFMEDRAATKYDLNKVSEFRKLLEQCK